MSKRREVCQSGPPSICKAKNVSYAWPTRSLRVMFDAVNRPPVRGRMIGTGGPPNGPVAVGLLGLTDATSNAAPAEDWAAGWDASPNITATHATTTTLFITALPLARQDRRRAEFHAPPQR